MSEQNFISSSLKALGIEALNSMQIQALEAISENPEIRLLSPTGSGKTLAFLLPLLPLLNPEVDQVQCMIIVPSRELALQIEQVWRNMQTGYKVTCCYGGHDMQTEIRSLSQPPALLIGTPGRILDHMHRQTFSTRSILTLVLDEFDKSLEMGFQDEMTEIVRNLRNVKKKILVSATAGAKVPSFVGFKRPIELDYITSKSAPDGLTIMQVVAGTDDKMDVLVRLISFLGDEATLIFCNQRDTVEEISQMLGSKGIACGFFHGKLEQEERERMLIRFRNGSLRFLAATDLAARGLDIPQMKHVIHYELPMRADEFTHRNGRTARMQSEGTAYVLRQAHEPLPEYFSAQPQILRLPARVTKPESAGWTTIYISGGKKNKLNKMDIVGFLIQKGKLEKQDLGLIEVKDTVSFVAVRTSKVEGMLVEIEDQKMKGKRFKIEVAR
ncbi:DEAD/DEAH box helicase [Dyadobacter tibetensis]|uniref:DEAD/DEAH box helicase n=1 Tax=Dyadobacter tibetensis TaxID=1211851 RepID=UPI0004724F1B|nr:DEAD/DEAH box helicase [Dyadobacter tibetensis]